MITQKTPKANLQFSHKRALELGMIGSLLIHLVVFRAVPAFDLGRAPVEATDIEISVEDIPPTEQIKRRPPPPRPSIPIPSESEDIPEDLTIEITKLDLSDISAPPPPEEGKYQNYKFIPYDEPPSPVGGYAAINKNLRYPEIARKAGIETKVIIGVLVDKNGNSVHTQILKGTGKTLGFEAAAQRALMAVKWHPARQRDRPVKVWISIPVVFKLNRSKT